MRKQTHKHTNTLGEKWCCSKYEICAAHQKHAFVFRVESNSAGERQTAQSQQVNKVSRKFSTLSRFTFWPRPLLWLWWNLKHVCVCARAPRLRCVYIPKSIGDIMQSRSLWRPNYLQYKWMRFQCSSLCRSTSKSCLFRHSSVFRSQNSLLVVIRASADTMSIVRPIIFLFCICTVILLWITLNNLLKQRTIVNIHISSHCNDLCINTTARDARWKENWKQPKCQTVFTILTQ